MKDFPYILKTQNKTKSFILQSVSNLCHKSINNRTTICLGNKSVIHIHLTKFFETMESVKLKSQQMKNKKKQL